MDLIDRVESTAALTDAVWCDGMRGDASAELSGLIAAVEGLVAGPRAVPRAGSGGGAVVGCRDRFGGRAVPRG